MALPIICSLAHAAAPQLASRTVAAGPRCGARDPPICTADNSGSINTGAIQIGTFCAMVRMFFPLFDALTGEGRLSSAAVCGCYTLVRDLAPAGPVIAAGKLQPGSARLA